MNNNDNAGNNLVDANIDNVNDNDNNLNSEESLNNTDFQNPIHQFENLQPIVEPKSKKYKKIAILIILILFILIVGYLIVSLVIKSKHNKVCTPIEEKVVSTAFEYADEESLLPINEGESVIIKLDDLYLNKKLNQTDVSIKNNVCSGSVKITKYKDEFIKTLNLKSCGYCTTDERYSDWSKETTKKPNSKNIIVDVTAYYNYYSYEDYNSGWTGYLKSDLISDEISKKYNIALPIDSKNLPNIPDEAKIIKIDKEDKTYYRYRDQKWKFYVDQGGNYTDYFSSEQPKGYSFKDEYAVKLTEWSEWSLNYPDKKSYRTIHTSAGYKWYYLDGKEKVYWNGGAYSVEQPSEKYNIKDTKLGSEVMYRYQDKTWRWYNGNKRKYSGYYSVAPKGYTNKDKDLTQYTNWTSWSDKTYLTNANSSYRIQETDIYSRYRIKYRMTSYMKLEQYLTLEEFEKETKTTLDEFLTKEKTSVDIIYKFKYRKK